MGLQRSPRLLPLAPFVSTSPLWEKSRFGPIQPTDNARAVISVKGGGIKSGDVRDLKGTMEREKAALGLFLTLNDPTREMEREAAAAGFYETGGMKFPRLQILTAAQILDNRRPQVPFGFTEGFRKAGREKTEAQDSFL